MTKTLTDATLYSNSDEGASSVSSGLKISSGGKRWRRMSSDEIFPRTLLPAFERDGWKTVAMNRRVEVVRETKGIKLRLKKQSELDHGDQGIPKNIRYAALRS